MLPPAAEVTRYNQLFRTFLNATRRRRKGFVPSLLFVAAFVFAAAALHAQSTDGLYRRISTELVQEALRIQQGQPGYWELLERAWRIDSENGDAQYLLSRRYLTEQRDQQIAEALLRDALTGERRIETSRVVATLGELYLRQRRYEAVVSLFDNYHQGNYHGQLITDGPGRADIRYLTAYLRVGNPWFTTAFLQRLRDRFPENADLAQIDFERSEGVSLSLLEWIDRRVRRGYELPPPLILSAIIAAEDEDLRYEMGRLYFESGGEDLLGAVPFLRDESTDIAPLIEGALRSLQHDKVALELAYRWYGDATLDRMTADMPEEGVLTVDEDRDGFWEERYTINVRRLTDWSYDEYQDGVIDRRLEIAAVDAAAGPEASGTYEAFDARVFHSRDVGEDRLIQVIEYAPYPNVAEVVRLRVAPSSSVEEMMTDNANLDRIEEALRWQPARPFAAPSILDGPRRGERWNAYSDRVRLEEEMIQRFDRQFESSNASTIDDAEAGELLSEFGILGLTPR